jgi:hypothetical protein
MLMIFLFFLNSHLISKPHSFAGKTENLRLVVAEPQPDLLTLYCDILNAVGHDVSVTTDSNKCLSLFKKEIST